jgi:hypothetical protein
VGGWALGASTTRECYLGISTLGPKRRRLGILQRILALARKQDKKFFVFQYIFPNYGMRAQTPASPVGKPCASTSEATSSGTQETTCAKILCPSDYKKFAKGICHSSDND